MQHDDIATVDDLQAIEAARAEYANGETVSHNAIFSVKERHIITEPDYWKYLIFNDDGEICGIADDAPESAKKSYADHLAEEKELMKQGIRLAR